MPMRSTYPACRNTISITASQHVQASVSNETGKIIFAIGSPYRPAPVISSTNIFWNRARSRSVCA